MSDRVSIQPGARVRIVGKPTAVTFRCRTGTVVREDEADYVLIRLDVPAVYRDFGGGTRELPEIMVMVDNLRVIGEREAVRTGGGSGREGT